MRSFAVILALLFAGRVFGQSGLYNVTYRPQPRVLIPTVEPSPVIVSNGVAIVNPDKDLRFCDFYLAAVDQSGTSTNPILFEFSSVSTNEQSGAVVFYQRSGPDYPASLLRRVGSTLTVTNAIATVTNQTVGVFTNWNTVISTTNFPTWVFVDVQFQNDQIYSYHRTNSSISVQSGGSLLSPVYSTLYAPIYTAGATNDKFYAYGATSQGGSVYRIIFTQTIGETFAVHVDSTGTFFRVGLTPVEETNFWYVAAFTNWTEQIVSANVLSVQAASSNEASAIEVFPIRQGQKWMKPTNPNIKWMCLLSNGFEWYSTPDGNPIWFNCAVDWVDRIPEVLQ